MTKKMKVSMVKKQVRTQNISKKVKPPKPPSVMKKIRITKQLHKSDTSSEEESSEEDSSEEESSEEESSKKDENCFVCKNKNCDFIFSDITKNTRRKCKKCGRLQLIRVTTKPKTKSVVAKKDMKSVKKTLCNTSNKKNIYEDVILRTAKLVIEENTNNDIEAKVNEVITKTKKLTIEETCSPKKKNINNGLSGNISSSCKSGTRDKWVHPLETPPIINNNLKIVDKIITKYIVTVPFIFSGRPVYCKHWNEQFNKEKLLSKLSFSKHWDLFSFMFVFVNCTDKMYTSKIRIFEKTEVDENDIKVQLTSDLTLLLRPTTYKDVLAMEKEMGNNYFKCRIVKNLRYATHFDTQVNLYAGQKLVDVNKTWVLHLILNEQNMSSVKYMSQEKIYFSNENVKNTYTLLNLYQALYLYFSRQITT